MIGLGRMGANMARRLKGGGVAVVGFDRDAAGRAALEREGILKAVDSLAGLVAALEAPRLVWVMLPSGAPTEQTITELRKLLAQGDVLIDGANGHFTDSQRHATELAQAGIGFVDVGVSGGVWGLANGYGLMIGGTPADVARVEPIARILAPTPTEGWLHCGPAGAGHYVKMVHNGIEYGLMQAYAEGFALMQAREDLQLDIAKIAESWRHGTVIRSWLLDLTAEFLKQDATLTEVAPYVADSGEGRWTALESIEQGVPTPVMTLALMLRFVSQGKDDFLAKLLAKMRQGFGGHPIKSV
ncbi:MAG: decarboxylating 6-phosphogluconate dehydrogenase [Steroidobacteraceae bacterium]